MFDAELSRITMLYSTGPWAEVITAMLNRATITIEICVIVG